MKYSLLLFGFFMLSTSFLMGQQTEGKPTRTAEQIADMQTERLQRDLNLTLQQRDTVHAIHLKYAKRRKATDEREQIIMRMDSMREELREVLSEEQFEHFMQKRRETGPQRQPTMRMVQSEAVADSIR